MTSTRRWAFRTVAAAAVTTVALGTVSTAAIAKPRPRLTKPTLSANVTSPTSSSSVTFTFSSTTTGVSFTCALDGKKSSCASPKSYSGLRDGNHTFSVVATKHGFRASPAATFAWTVDRTPPIAVTAFHNVPTAPVSVANAPDITFTGTEANETFVCRVDVGTHFPCLADTPGSTKTAAATSNGTHTLTVTPTDAAGNVGPPSSVGWEIDTVGPKVTIADKPSTNPFTSVTVHFTVNGVNAATGAVSCTLDDGSGPPVVQSACNTLGNGQHSLTVSTPDGASDIVYTLSITATDDVGLQGQDSATWTHSHGAPAPPIFLNGPAAYINNPSSAAAQITWDDSSHDTFTCKVDTVDVGTCTQPFDPANVSADGPHSVQVVDQSLGSAPSTWTWTLDTLAPSLTVAGGPGARTNVDKVAFVISASVAANTAPLVSLVCTLTGPTTFGPAACPPDGTFPTTGPQLAAGKYSLDVAATDAAGNVKHVVRTWTVDRTPPTVSIAGLSSLTGPISLKWSEAVNHLGAGTVALTLTDTAAPVATARSCFNAGGKRVSCATTFRTIKLTPNSHLVPGQHYTLEVADSAVSDLAGNVSAAKSAPFRAARRLEENSVAATAAWQKVSAKAAYGASYVRDHFAGAVATYRFRGKTVKWWTVTGPTQGKAAVSVDGHRKPVVDNYARGTHYRVARTLRRLGAGAHTLTIRVLGRKGAKAGRGTFVSIDAITAAGKLVKTPKLATRWQRAANAKFFAGHAAVADLAGASYTVVFRGTGVTWWTATNRSQGKARVFLDGVLKSTIDNYSAAATYHVARALSHLTDKVHTLRIVVLGKHRKGGRGNKVTVDRFSIA